MLEGIEVLDILKASISVRLIFFQNLFATNVSSFVLRLKDSQRYILVELILDTGQSSKQISEQVIQSNQFLPLREIRKARVRIDSPGKACPLTTKELNNYSRSPFFLRDSLYRAEEPESV